jgi:hypothetical protein
MRMKGCLLIWRSFAKNTASGSNHHLVTLLLPLGIRTNVSVEESRMQNEKRPSHHFSLYTNSILSVPAMYVNKKSYKIFFFSQTIIAHNSPYKTGLGLNWLCFLAAQNRKIPHNTLSYKTLRQFNPPENWLCFFKSPIHLI